METQTETIQPTEPITETLPPQNIPQTDEELVAWWEHRKRVVRAQTGNTAGSDEASTHRPGKFNLKPHTALQVGRLDNSPVTAPRMFRAEMQPVPFLCPNCQTECAYKPSADVVSFGGLTTYLRGECLCEASKREKHEAEQAELRAKMEAENRRARIVQYRQNSGIYGDLWDRTFDAFDPNRDELARDAFYTVRAWAETFKPGETKKGFALSSPGFGCGKTHLSIAAGIHVLNLGYSVRYISLKKWLDEQRAEFQKSCRFSSYDSDSGESVGKPGAAMKKTTNCALLIIDDFGAEQIRSGEEGDWARQQIFTLLDDRVNCGRPVIATTNLDSGKIAARIGGEHGGRCASRLAQIAKWVYMDGPDGRLL